MPKIGVHISGQAGAGMAAGLQRAREIRYQEDEAEFLRQRREKGESEERAAHSWFDRQYETIEQDPIKREAFTPLPLEMKGAIMRQAAEERALQAKVRGVQQDLQYLSANPRTQQMAQELQAQIESDPLSVDLDAVAKQLDKARKEAANAQAVVDRGMRALAESQEWMQQPGLKPEDYDMGAFFLATGKLQNALEMSQDPNMQPLDQDELAQMMYDIEKAKIKRGVLGQIEADAQARIMAEQDEIFREGLGPQEETTFHDVLAPILERWGFGDIGGGQPQPQPPPTNGQAAAPGGGDEFTRLVQEQAPAGGEAASPEKQGAFEPQHLAVPWKDPAKSGGRLRPISEAEQTGEVYDRLIADLHELVVVRKDFQRAKQLATAAGLLINDDLKARIRDYKPKKGSASMPAVDLQGGRMVTK